MIVTGNRPASQPSPKPKKEEPPARGLPRTHSPASSAFARWLTAITCRSTTQAHLDAQQLRPFLGCNLVSCLPANEPNPVNFGWVNPSLGAGLLFRLIGIEAVIAKVLDWLGFGPHARLRPALASRGSNEPHVEATGGIKFRAGGVASTHSRPDGAGREDNQISSTTALVNTNEQKPARPTSRAGLRNLLELPPTSLPKE
jgi:hypothetical protein